MSTEVTDIGDLLLTMIENGCTTFKQGDVVQELTFPDADGTGKIHFSLAIRITKAELPTGEAFDL